MKKIYLKVCAILCILFVSSCTVENSLLERNEEDSFTLEQARANFENNAADLKLVSFLQSQNLNKARTKSEGETDWENIVPDWDNASFGQKEAGVAYMIPITLPGNLKAKLNLSIGRYRTYYHKDETVKSYLVVEKRHDGTVKRFITTSIGDSGNRTSSEKPYLYTGSRRHFNGLFIVSSESGEAQLAYYYVNGRRFKMHISKDDDIHDHINSKSNKGSVGFIFRGSKPMTKGGDGGNSTGEDDMAYCYTCHQTTTWVLGTINGSDRLVCSKCGLPAEEIGGGELYFFCSVCGKLEANCICGNNNPDPNIDPYPDPDEDECCPVCGFLWEHCNCYHEGGTGGGSGNGNYGNNGEPDGGIKYVRKNGDVLVINNLITEFQSQITNSTCLYNAIRYILNNCGNSISNDGKIASRYTEYLFQIGHTSSEELINSITIGFNPQHFIGFVNYLFYTTAYDGNMINCIDSHNFILFYNDDGESLHALVVVGYEADGTQIVYDPTYGYLTEGTYYIDIDKSIAITGAKDGK